MYFECLKMAILLRYPIVTKEWYHDWGSVIGAPAPGANLEGARE